MSWIGCAWAWTTGHATILAAVVSALAAVAIAWFTLTLKLSTDKLWKASEKQALDMKSIRIAEESADAAKVGADAAKVQAEIAESTFRDLERPYVFIDRFEIIATRSPSIPSPRLSVGFYNYGRTPAIMEKFLVSFQILGPDPQDGVVMLSGAESRSLSSVVGPQQPSENFPLALELPWADWEKIQKSEARLHIQILVSYADVFGNPWRGDFRYYWNGDLATFLWEQLPKPSRRQG